MIRVKDGSRTLQFEGRLIADSTSWRRGVHRWVEFKLYRTDEREVYVLSRVGMSLLYHDASCDVVRRNNLREAPRSELSDDAKPCDECQPDMTTSPIICPERPRHWAQVCETPEAVLDQLYKYDSAGSRYLTFVARRLLDVASDSDAGIEGCYRVETLH